MSPVEFDQKKKPTLKGSDSTRTTDSVRLYPQLAIFYWQSNTFTRTVCDDHIKWHWNEPDCIEGWNKFSVRIWSPWEPNLTHRRQLSLTEGESNFLPLPVFFFGVSSAIAKVPYDTLFFTQWNFPSSGRSTNENLWEIVASSPFLSPSRLRLSLT